MRDETLAHILCECGPSFLIFQKILFHSSPTVMNPFTDWNTIEDGGTVLLKIRKDSLSTFILPKRLTFDI